MKLEDDLQISSLDADLQVDLVNGKYCSGYRHVIELAGYSRFVFHPASKMCGSVYLLQEHLKQAVPLMLPLKPKAPTARATIMITASTVRSMPITMHPDPLLF